MANEQFYTLVTSKGQQLIAAATSGGDSVELTHMAVGDGNGAYYVPTENQTVLKNEKSRVALNSLIQDKTNANWFIAEAVLPDDVGGFMIREVGVYDKAGNLFAIGNVPDTYKPTLAMGTDKQLYIRCIFQVSNADSVTLKIDPSIVLATRAYVDDAVGKIDIFGKVSKTGDAMTGDLTFGNDASVSIVYPAPDAERTKSDSWNALNINHYWASYDVTNATVMRVGSPSHSYNLARIGNLANTANTLITNGSFGWLFNARLGQDGKLYKDSSKSGWVTAMLTDAAGVVRLLRGQTTEANGAEIAPSTLTPYVATTDAELITLSFLLSKGYVRSGSNGSSYISSADCITDAGTLTMFSASSNSSMSGTHNACIASTGCSHQGNIANQAAIIAATNCAVGDSQAGTNIIVTGVSTVAPNNNTFAGGFSAGSTKSAANRTVEINFSNGNINITGKLTPSATFTDYAEYFENKEKGILPLGSIVALDGRFVRLATGDDEVLGVVSATGCVAAGDSNFCWAKRYLTGEFGERLYHDIPDPQWQPKVLDMNWQPEEGQSESDRPLIDNPEPQKPVTLPIENPDFDITQENIPRSKRPEEWTCVGLLGQVHVRADESINVGDWVKPVGGIGTKSETKTNLRCMEIRQAYDKDKGYAVAFCLLK